MPDEKTQNDRTIDARFFHLVATFEAAAMQQLGKIAHPLTGEVEVNLDGARESIDIVDMIESKTRGNLTSEEKRLIDHILYQLRMNYVDVAKSDEKSSGDTGSAPQGADDGETGDDESDAGATATQAGDSDDSGSSSESSEDASNSSRDTTE
jgi:hypothetical protein